MIYIVTNSKNAEQVRELIDKYPHDEVKVVNSIDEVPEDVREWVKVGEANNSFPNPIPYFKCPEIVDDTQYQVSCAEKALKKHKDRKQQNTYALRYLNKHYKK